MSIDDKTAAVIGTDQLSSTTSSNSTPADARLMKIIFAAISEKPISTETAPVLISHADNPIEHNEAPMKKAAEPAIDFDGLNDHLFFGFFPNRLPNISASPSPAAMVDNAMTPVKLSRKNSATAENKIMTYISGPLSASFASPLLLIAPASSFSPKGKCVSNIYYIYSLQQ
eukprot:715003_1